MLWHKYVFNTKHLHQIEESPIEEDSRESETVNPYESVNPF